MSTFDPCRDGAQHFNYPHTLPSADMFAADLAPLGVRLDRLSGPMQFSYCPTGHLHIEIGRVVVQRDIITARPYRDARDGDVQILLYAAAEAFRRKPTKADNWNLHRGNTGTWWSTEITRPAASNERAELEAAYQPITHDQRTLAELVNLPGDLEYLRQ